MNHVKLVKAVLYSLTIMNKGKPKVILYDCLTGKSQNSPSFMDKWQEGCGFDP